MTIELAIFISTISFLFNTITIWAIGRMSHTQRAASNRLWHRIHYLEVSLAYHELVPMPWELDDLDEHYEEIKGFKREGNVVYLQKEEK